MDFHVSNLSLTYLLNFHILILLIFLNLSIPQSASAAILGNNERDKLAFLDFKSKLSSDPRQVVSSWNDWIHFCEWRGVTCDITLQRVISLDLTGLKLAGIVSPKIGNLSFLETLYLSDNTFTSIIPQELGSLTRLKNLNFFEMNIPSNLSSYKNLINLDLNHNS